MSFKGWFLLITAVVFLTITAFILIFLRKAVVEADVARGNAQVESNCANQMQHAVDLVMNKAGAENGKSRVTETSNHYNRLLHQCYVEVTTYEHEDSAVFTKTLVSPNENSVVLWSVTGRADVPGRHCFGFDTMPIDCETADKRWKAYMAE